MLPVDIDVWLSTERQAEMIKVIPYVRTAEEMHVGYQVDLLRKGNGGLTKITQKGKVVTSAQTPGSLGQMAVDTRNTGSCRIRIVLTSADGDLGTYEFDCPS